MWDMSNVGLFKDVVSPIDLYNLKNSLVGACYNDENGRISIWIKIKYNENITIPLLIHENIHKILHKEVGLDASKQFDNQRMKWFGVEDWMLFCKLNSLKVKIKRGLCG